MTTYAHDLQISILNAPLAQIDRRTLSQAWYSALHLAHEPSHAPRAPQNTREIVPRSRASGEPARAEHHPQNHTLPASSPHAAGSTNRLPAEERRCERSALARKIERLFLRPTPQTRRATFTLNGDAARIRVMLVARGAGQELIAICPPRLHAIVARALTQARYALAARGIALHAQIRAEHADAS